MRKRVDCFSVALRARARGGVELKIGYSHTAPPLASVFAHLGKYAGGRPTAMRANARQCAPVKPRRSQKYGLLCRPAGPDSPRRFENETASGFGRKGEFPRQALNGIGTSHAQKPVSRRKGRFRIRTRRGLGAGAHYLDELNPVFSGQPQIGESLSRHRRIFGDGQNLLKAFFRRRQTRRKNRKAPPEAPRPRRSPPPTRTV